MTDPPLANAGSMTWEVTWALILGFTLSAVVRATVRRSFARSLFRKGADFTAAMAFEIASTKLVIELGIIMALLMGRQFTAVEFVGGPLMIVVLAVLFRLFLRGRVLHEVREQAARGIAGSMEGHAVTDVSVGGDGGFARRLFSRDGYTSVSHIFVVEWPRSRATWWPGY
ncbi:permease [Streptomyces sp. CA-249302]|uniref:permease n=1 Tax=Streptomyces sp. CA-249302 TaxID=3240058 RepID=UPI003D8AF695